jgi:tetratricopeptide (TPR) repeat protein
MLEKRGRIARCLSLACLADLCRRQGRLSEAETFARHALEAHSEAYPASETAIRLRLFNVQAEILREQGRIEEAESLCERSQQLIGKDSEYFSRDRCLATLARIRIGQNRLAEAEVLFRRCLAILEQSAPEHPERVKRLQELAVLLRTLDRPDEAEKLEAEAKAIPVSVFRA